VSLAERARLVLPEALQEAKRLSAPTSAPKTVRIKLKRSDPRVQELLRLVETLANEVHTESGLVVTREKLAGSAEMFLAALRRCDVPIDDMLRDAGIVGADRMGALDVGLGVMAAFGAAFGGKTRDAIKAMQERVQAVKEGDL
jgi:hypothetical protein